MNLRDYQTDLINQTRQAFRNSKRVLSVLPCGGGKTVMFAYMAQHHLSRFTKGYVWFLVHRQELISQTVNTFKNNNISLNNVLINMVQSVSLHLDRYKKPSLIIFDEAHHSSARTWQRIIETYPDVPVIGLTATPCRMDGKPLGDIYDELCVGVSAEWLINHNYLSQYRYYAPHIDLEESKWQIKGSDYNQESVAETLDKQQIYGDILKYIDLNKKTIIYAPNIKYSIKLSTEINSFFKSCVCKHFDGSTNDSERKQIIEDFRNGKIRVLTNVDLIGEGFDVPDCDCCMLLRPTMSTSLYIQQSMRCLRFKENKIAYIYDFVGNVFKHGMPTDDRLWSLDKSVKTRNKTDEKDLIVRECKNCFRVYKGTNPICPYCGFNNGKTKKQIEQDRKKELEEITELQRKKERIEIGKCRDFASLVALGKKRGYRNPAYWANTIIKSRLKKY